MKKILLILCVTLQCLIVTGCATTFVTQERSKDFNDHEKKHVTVLFPWNLMPYSGLSPIDMQAIFVELNKEFKKYSIEASLPKVGDNGKLLSDYVLILAISKAEVQSVVTYQGGVKVYESSTKIATGKINWKAHFLKIDSQNVSLSNPMQTLLISNNKNKDDVIKTIWIGESGNMNFSTDQYVAGNFSKLYTQLADALIGQLASENIIRKK